MKKRLTAALLTMSLVGVCVMAIAAQPPEGKGPPGGRKFQPGGAKDKASPPRFEPGRILSPQVREALHLSEDQVQQLAALEKQVKEKLLTILSDEQTKQLEKINRRPDRGGPDNKGKGPPPGDDDRPRGKSGKKAPPNDDRPNHGEKKGPPRPPRPSPPGADDDGKFAGIQWYGTLERGLKEAQRSGRPILFLSAAPHCGGISGIW
jgi:hypothetical protein